MGPKPHNRDKQWLLERIKVIGECWEWQRSKVNGGYGHFRYSDGGDFKNKRAHRLAWELFRGPIPEGMCVLHRCDNPPCCNPDHLFLGSKADNTMDMVDKGRAAGGSLPGKSNPDARLTEDDVRAIRGARADGVRVASLAAAYGVSGTTIYKIVSRKSWSHVQ